MIEKFLAIAATKSFFEIGRNGGRTTNNLVCQFSSAVILHPRFGIFPNQIIKIKCFAVSSEFPNRFSFNFLWYVGFPIRIFQSILLL